MTSKSSDVMDVNKKLLVGAIDFGTTYSGWAYSLDHDFKSDPTKGYVKQWLSGGTLTTEKAPTCLLIKPDGKTLDAFGYDAENKYKGLAEDGQHNGYYYFRRFKMLLNKKLGEKLDKNITIDDAIGQPLPALQVFSMSIKYLFDDMISVIGQRLLGSFTAEDVHIVLTVPAIWSDSAKQFMRLAAQQAGISSMNLTIALEPEAASIFCRHQPLDKTLDQGKLAMAKLVTGTRYMIIDAGGGTIDITVHEVVSSQSVKEITGASGGGWGGILVDKAFEDFLIDVFGVQVYEEFKKEKREDWLDLWRDFEVKKRNVKPDGQTRVVMRFPLALKQTLKTLRHIKVSEAIAMSKYTGEVEIDGDRLKFAASLFKSFFDNSIRLILGHVKSLYRDEQVRTINAMLMVGGYSESPMLQKAIKSEFSGIDVIIPACASSAILRGALVYGHSPVSISERILKYTYGVDVLWRFREGKDPEERKLKTDYGNRCCRFEKHVQKGQVVKCNESQSIKKYTTEYLNQKSMSFQLYATELEDLVYPDEGGMLIGELTIEFDSPDETQIRSVEVSMTFSGTEIKVKAVDTTTGKEEHAYMDFLG